MIIMLTERTFLLVDNIFNFIKYDEGSEWVLVFHISDHVSVYAHLLGQSYLREPEEIKSGQLEGPQYNWDCDNSIDNRVSIISS